MTFEDWYFKEIGVTVADANARNVYDLGIMRKCWTDSGNAERARSADEIERLSADAGLLAWVLLHPETAAECLEDAAAGDGNARDNLEFRRDALGPNGAVKRPAAFGGSV